MKAMRRQNPMAYKQPRWHLIDGEGTKAICGTDVAAVKGDLRGAIGRGRLQTKEVDGDLGSDYSLCASCRKKASGTGGSIKLATHEMKALLARACEAATKAYTETIPTPMVVGTPKDMMASLMGKDDGGFDPNEPVYVVPGGICGSAYLLIRPANSRLANFLRREGYGSYDSYAKCLRISAWKLVTESSAHGSQSVTRLYAAASAAAAVMREAGISASPDEWIN
jgi:hypothetical protein